MKQGKKELKFEEAYSLTVEDLLTVDDVAHICNKSLELFASEYKKSFVCPECRKARLLFANSEPPYFRSYPKEPHDENCSLQQDVISPKKVAEYVDSIANAAQIERQIEGLITMLLSANGSSVHSKAAKEVSKDKASQQSKSTSHVTAKKYLPRKRIDTFISDDDLGVYKLFYGIVSLKWISTKTGKYGIILSNAKNNLEICKIWISEQVYSHIYEYCKTPEEYICAITVLASFKKDSNGVLYTSLRRSRFLHVEKIR